MLRIFTRWLPNVPPWQAKVFYFISLWWRTQLYLLWENVQFFIGFCLFELGRIQIPERPWGLKWQLLQTSSEHFHRNFIRFLKPCLRPLLIHRLTFCRQVFHSKWSLGWSCYPLKPEQVRWWLSFELREVKDSILESGLRWVPVNFPLEFIFEFGC